MTVFPSGSTRTTSPRFNSRTPDSILERSPTNSSVAPPGAAYLPAVAVEATIPSSPEAARYYAEGLARLREFDAQGARGLVEKAVAAEPGFLLGHSAPAASWAALGYDENAKQEAKKAFDLSSKLSREERLSIEGRYRETAQEWDKATEIYKALFNFFRDDLEYGLRLAFTETSAGRGKEALAVVGTMRKMPPRAREDHRIDLEEATAARSISANKQSQAAAARAAVKGRELGRALWWPERDSKKARLCKTSRNWRSRNKPWRKPNACLAPPVTAMAWPVHKITSLLCL